MKRELKNTGEYFECDADALFDNIEKLKCADIIVIKNSRIELSGEEKDKFVSKLQSRERTKKKQIKDFNNKQKSDFIFREIILK